MLKVTMIGCGATMPLPARAAAACAIQYQGRNVLLDCGEGTQTAARKAGISLFKIDAVCLTHYHGDHIFGLPGLLQTMASQGRVQPVLLTGPEEEYEKFISLLLTLAGPLPFEVIRHPLSASKNRENLWDGLQIESFSLNHRVPCVGYRFSIKRAGRFLPEKARALSVPCKLWGKLQKGEAVENERGEKILPDQVLGAPQSGLSVVYATDTSLCDQLTVFSKEADLLICDATYAQDEEEDKARLYGHSTFSQCGHLAAQNGVKRLWLTHYGGAVTNPEEYLYKAKDIFPAAEAGFDGKTLELNFSDRK